jgi:hypothetical protein
MGEVTDIEMLAVALHESHCRYISDRLSTATPVHARRILDEDTLRTVDWYSLRKEERTVWRERAREMVRDAVR